MSKHKSVSTPFLVAVIGALSILLGVFLLLAAVLSGVLAGVFSEIAMPAGVTGVGLAVGGILCIVIGWGFLQGWKVMWYLGVILYIAGAVLSLLSLPAGILGIIISLVVLWYLSRPNVKKYFLED